MAERYRALAWVARQDNPSRHTCMTATNRSPGRAGDAFAWASSVSIDSRPLIRPPTVSWTVANATVRVLVISSCTLHQSHQRTPRRSFDVRTLVEKVDELSIAVVQYASEVMKQCRRFCILRRRSRVLEFEQVFHPEPPGIAAERVGVQTVAQS